MFETPTNHPESPEPRFHAEQVPHSLDDPEKRLDRSSDQSQIHLFARPAPGPEERKETTAKILRELPNLERAFREVLTPAEFATLVVSCRLRGIRESSPPSYDGLVSLSFVSGRTPIHLEEPVSWTDAATSRTPGKWNGQELGREALSDEPPDPLGGLPRQLAQGTLEDLLARVRAEKEVDRYRLQKELPPAESAPIGERRASADSEVFAKVSPTLWRSEKDSGLVPNSFIDKFGKRIAPE